MIGRTALRRTAPAAAAVAAADAAIRGLTAIAVPRHRVRARAGNASCRGHSSMPQPAPSYDDDEEEEVGSPPRQPPRRPSRAPSSRLQRLREVLKVEDRRGIVPVDLRGGGGGGSGCGGAAADAAAQDGKDAPWREVLERARAEDRARRLGLAAVGGESDEERRRRERAAMLTDSHRRHHTYLRISLSERCNLRCRYCMPPEGVPLSPSQELLTDAEVLDLVRLFASGGVDKIRLTGGEPTLRPTLAPLIASIREQNPGIRSVGITTNALTLSRQLPALMEAGLTHANISLDTLDAARYNDVTRRDGLARVLRAIDDSLEAFGGMYPGTASDPDAGIRGRVKINCVVMKGFNDDELRQFCLLARDQPVDVRFIEWMPFSDNGWSKGRFLSYSDTLARIRGDEQEEEEEEEEEGGHGYRDGDGGDARPLPLQRLEDGPNDTTKWWHVTGHRGRIGFITSMTSNFCGTCNRLRIMADGSVKACLFGSSEVSLRDAMRDPDTTEDDLALLVSAAVGRKQFALGGHGNAEGIRKANDNRPMTLIGG